MPLVHMLYDLCGIFFSIHLPLFTRQNNTSKKKSRLTFLGLYIPYGNWGNEMEKKKKKMVCLRSIIPYYYYFIHDRWSLISFFLCNSRNFRAICKSKGACLLSTFMRFDQFEFSWKVSKCRSHHELWNAMIIISLTNSSFHLKTEWSVECVKFWSNIF